MIALDTNVLIRFLVEDDQEQSKRAARLIQQVIEEGDVVFLSDVVVAESVWVLDRSYRFTRAEIAAVLKKLLTARHVAFESSDRIARALRAFEAGRGGFADYLIWDHAHASGCDRIATFDAALLGDPDFFSP